ncbi:MAG: MoaD/ThiS family protein [Oscillospiraceae bacterium]|nr:MoaD/ThiS family protein [Oscillospiraceae bacterium]
MKVKFYGSALKYTGGMVSVNMDPKCCPDLHALINELAKSFGEDFKQLILGGETWLVLVNAASVKATGGLNTKLKQGDIIEVLPIIGAG